MNGWVILLTVLAGPFVMMGLLGYVLPQVLGFIGHLFEGGKSKN